VREPGRTAGPFARDDKWRVVTSIRGRQIGWTEEKQQVAPLCFARDDKFNGPAHLGTGDRTIKNSNQPGFVCLRSLQRVEDEHSLKRSTYLYRIQQSPARRSSRNTLRSIDSLSTTNAPCSDSKDRATWSAQSSFTAPLHILG
jgi:hypothetical protein